MGPPAAPAASGCTRGCRGLRGLAHSTAKASPHLAPRTAPLPLSTTHLPHRPLAHAQLAPLPLPSTSPPQTLDGEIEDNIQAMISLDQQERLQELAKETAMA